MQNSLRVYAKFIKYWSEPGMGLRPERAALVLCRIFAKIRAMDGKHAKIENEDSGL